MFLDSLPNLHALGLFAVASILVASSPGPTWIYVIGAATAGGWRDAIVAIAGNILGVGLHVIISALGLSMVLAASPLFMKALNVVGGAYLVYLGVNRLFSSTSFRMPVKSTRLDPPSKILVSAALINALNPKVLLLFLALLPQFVDPINPFFPQALTFGTLHILIATTILLGVSAIVIGMHSSSSVLEKSGVWRVINVGGGITIAFIGINLMLHSMT